MTKRETAHALLDKILDGGHKGNIDATLATMRVYAEAIDERMELDDLRREAAGIKLRIREMESILSILPPKKFA